MTRKSWDAHFLSIAKAASEMSTCPRASVGAVIVKYNREIATGFNGAAKGESHCTDVGCLTIHDHCIRTIHAEANAIMHAGERGHGATIYVTHAPCYYCAGLIINAGIIRIVYAQDYGNEAGPERLGKAGIE